MGYINFWSVLMMLINLGFMKYATEMTSDSLTYIHTFMTIDRHSTTVMVDTLRER
jgi:hypothetical protein